MSTTCIACHRVLNDSDADKQGRCCYCVDDATLAEIPLVGVDDVSARPADFAETETDGGPQT